MINPQSIIGGLLIVAAIFWSIGECTVEHPEDWYTVSIVTSIVGFGFLYWFYVIPLI